MDEQEFDRFAEDYTRLHQQSIRVTGEDVDFFAAYKVQDMREVWLGAEGSEPHDILDFGGGVGASAPHLSRLFPKAQITIADVSRRSLEMAESRGVVRVSTRHFDGKTLPFDDASFDMALAACVFHHIDRNAHVASMAEIRRVLRRGGRLMLFEHNPWNPLTRRAVNTCPFDLNAVLITAPELKRRMEAAGFASVSTAYRIFFPNLLKSLRPLEAYMTWLPLGAQYRCVGVA
jgi:ubiquinone/menaquinone biosynthesis C-methylase UbiE